MNRPLQESETGGAAPAAHDSRELLLMQLDRRWRDTHAALNRKTAATGESASDVPVQIGPYTVERELGRGGFGVVLLARDERLDRSVALKVPRPEVLGNAAVRERFLREAEAVAALAHPNIVPVYEVGQLGPVDFIASQYCPHGSLADALAAGKTFSPRQSAQLIQHLAEAVEHIHSHGLLHRDLKPSNVLLAEKDEEHDRADELPFRPLVTDFGLAKLVEQSFYETGSSVMLGTPLYMSPEQAACQQHRIGPWTDVYSLGVMLYELLTGRAPFLGPGLVAVLTELQTAEPTPPRSLRSTVPRELETICLKCLAKDPADRYQIAAELAADLDRYLAGKRISARRPNAAQRILKWCRNPRRISEAGMTAIVLNSGFMLWFCLEVPYTLLAPDIDVDRMKVFHGQIGVTVGYIIPLFICGICALRHNRMAIWLGTCIAVPNLVFCVLGLIGLIDPFGDLYDGSSLMRVVVFGLVTCLITAQFLAFVAATIAIEYERKTAASPGQ